MMKLLKDDEIIKNLSAVAYVSLLVRVVQVDDSVLSDFCLILY